MSHRHPLVLIVLVALLASCQASIQSHLPPLELESDGLRPYILSQQGQVVLPEAVLEGGLEPLSEVLAIEALPPEGNPDDQGHGISLRLEDGLVVTPGLTLFFQGRFEARDLRLALEYDDGIRWYGGLYPRSPDPSIVLEHAVMLEEGRRLLGFRFMSSAPWAVDMSRWVIRKPDWFAYGPDFRHVFPAILGSINDTVPEARFPTVYRLAASDRALEVLIPPEGTKDDVRWALPSGGFAVRSHQARDGSALGRRLWFPAGSVRGPGSMVALESRGATLGELRYRPYPWTVSGTAEPLPLDFVQLLMVDPAAEGAGDFAVRPWSIFPEIRALVFVDYATQSRYLGRLAFFLEKRGFRGRILSNEEIQGLHDWNAHNYRPEGLAEFYNQARRDGVVLRDEEAVLRDRALEWGLLREGPDGYLPGVGGMVSFARDPRSWDQVRRLLLGHELLHGIYYMVPELRDLTATLWRDLDPRARDFMKAYFTYMNYDPADSYLMENEFQSYMLQQNEAALFSLVENQWLPRIRGGQTPAAFQGFRDNIRVIQRELVQARRALHALVEEKAGLHPPEFSEYLPVAP